MLPGDVRGDAEAIRQPEIENQIEQIGIERPVGVPLPCDERLRSNSKLEYPLIRMRSPSWAVQGCALSTIKAPTSALRARAALRDVWSPILSPPWTEPPR